jgi:gliding motility-associated-like protein
MLMVVQQQQVEHLQSITSNSSITGDNEICAGENTIFTANGGATYLWNTAETSASITVDAAIEYIVTVTDLNGCTATASRTLTVTPLPNAGADVSVTCYETGVAVMSASGVGTWTLGTSAGTAIITNPNSATTTITNFSINGTYELIWTVGSCSDTVLVTVGDDCDCAIVNNIILPINGQFCNEVSNVNITASVASPAGGDYQWEYSFNAGPFTPIALSNVSDLTTQVLGVGNHRFRRIYTITGPIACSDTSNIVALRVNPNPTAIIIGDNEICAGENSIFTANGGAIYLWDTNETSSFITVSVAREYIVTVTDVNGCTATASRTLTVTPLPNAGADVSVTCYETGVAVMSASGVGTWTLGTSAGTAIITNPNSATTTITNFSINGTYELIWTVGSCSDTVLVTVGDDCDCAIVNNIILPINGQFCNEVSNVNITASVASPAGGDYQWEYSFNAGPFTPIALSNVSDLTTQVLGVGNHRFRRIYTITGPIACSDTSNIVALRVNPNPTAIIIGDSEICAGENSIFTANGGAIYLWDTNETSSFITVSVAREYVVTVTNVNGCTATASRTLTVNPLPIVSITGNNTICAGENTIFTANGGVTYLWDTNETSSFITVSVAREYIVTVTDVNGCTATASRTLTVNPLPIASITGDNEICAGENTVFTANGGASYLWNTTETSASITVNLASDYIVTVTDLNGCTATASRTLTVNPLPIASIVGDNEICFGENTIFTVNGGVTYLWDTNETTSFITVSAAREYIVTVTDVNGCTATASRTLTVNPLPIASITGDNEICAGENTIFTVNGGSSYLWSTTEMNASITVNLASEYIVTVTDANGCTATASRTLTVNPLPNASITGDNEICAGENTIFTANGGASYIWSNGKTSAAITVSVSNDYTVTVTDINGCTASTSRVLTVGQEVNAAITGNNNICFGTSTLFTASGGSSYLWNTGAVTPSITVTDADTYSVVVTDANGCTASASRVLSVGQEVNARISGNTKICQGATSIFTASGGSTYLWNTDETTNSITVAENGLYSVSVYDAAGCYDVASLSLEVTDRLDAPFDVVADKDPICLGDTVTLTVSGIDGAVFNWSSSSVSSGLQNGLSAESIVIPTAPGTYTYTITQKFEACQLESLPIEITLVVNDLPRFNIGSDTTICELDGGIMLSVDGFDNVVWSDGTERENMFIRSKGKYSVEVTDDHGCMSSDEITIKNFCCRIYHPNIISLSSTSGNDQFSMTETSCVITSKLSIYDRWGNMVYRSDNGLEPWDGTYKGQPVEIGVYAFIFTYTALDEDDNLFEDAVKGDVTVIR